MTRYKRMRGVLGILAVLSLGAAACSDDSDDSGEGEEEAAGQDETGEDDTPAPSEGGTLAEVQDRGTLNCGVNDVVPGFGLTNEEGGFEGFDIEFCRVVAAAVLGDAEAVEYFPLSADDRFTALQSGEIDVLIRNTTRTASRDGTETGNFLTTTFYDGQGMMVKADSGFESIDDMEDTTICVLSGTTTQLNLESRFRGLTYEPAVYETNDEIQPVFSEDACDGWTSDVSQLAGVRSDWPEDQGGPESLVILEDESGGIETFSKEPLTPVIRDGDEEWAAAVDWAIMSTIQAEEFGITSENLGEMRNSDEIPILRFLGEPIAEEEGAEPAPFDPGLNLSADFAVNVIEQVGNYGEIFERTVGSDSALGIDRETFNNGANQIWTEGGLLYAPPYI